jgi:hypothetical protein
MMISARPREFTPWRIAPDPGRIVGVGGADAPCTAGEVRRVEQHEGRVFEELLSTQILAVAEDAAHPGEVGTALDGRGVGGNRDRLDGDGAHGRELPPAEEDQNGHHEQYGADDGRKRDSDPLQQLAHRSPRKVRRKRPAFN